MKRKDSIAYQIWQIRDELEIPGNKDHDWCLADLFLQCHKGTFDNDDIYLWFTQLEENLDKDQSMWYNGI